MRAIVFALAALAFAPAAWAAEPAPQVSEPKQGFKAKNPLEEALILAATDPEQRDAFNKLLLESEVYLATPERPAEAGERQLKAGEKLNLLNARDQDGKSIPAIFTSIGRIAAFFGPGTGYIAMNGRAALEMLADGPDGKAGGVVLNPGADYGVYWTASDVSMLLGRPVSRTLKKDTPIEMGQAKQRPDRLIAGIEAIAAGDPRISEVWLALAHWPETDEWVWLLEVGTTAPRDEVAPLFGKLSGADFFDGKPLDVIILPPNQLHRAGYRIKPAKAN